MIETRSFDFALKIILLTQALKEERQYLIANQLLRSATSIGANVSEAGAGQTKKDFIAKMAIASKEARETRYLLKLIKESDVFGLDVSPFLDEIEEIIKILTKIVKTSQANISKT